MEKNSNEARHENENTRLSLVTWMRLAHVYTKVCHAVTEHLRRWSLSLAHFDVLVHVSEAEGLTQQELADRLLVTKGNVCYLVDRLEQQHLVIRRSEGRINRLFLTEQGRQLYDEIIPEHREVIASLFSSLPPETQSNLHIALRTLDQTLT
jgi:DNA-binding MarR family transcriptional regulator